MKLVKVFQLLKIFRAIYLQFRTEEVEMKYCIYVNV